MEYCPSCRGCGNSYNLMHNNKEYVSAAEGMKYMLAGHSTPEYRIGSADVIAAYAPMENTVVPIQKKSDDEMVKIIPIGSIQVMEPDRVVMPLEKISGREFLDKPELKSLMPKDEISSAIMRAVHVQHVEIEEEIIIRRRLKRTNFSSAEFFQP